MRNSSGMKMESTNRKRASQGIRCSEVGTFYGRGDFKLVALRVAVI